MVQLTIKDETKEKLVRSKSKLEFKTGKTITWDEYLVMLVDENEKGK